MYRTQRSPLPHHPPEKKTRQNSSIYSVSGVRLNINCVIFIHFLSLNSPLIYQFNVSWGFFSTGRGLSPPPTPTPSFDLRRLILSIVAFVRMLLPCKYAVPILLASFAFFLWDLQATIFRNSYLIKKEKTVCWLFSLHLGGRDARACGPWSSRREASTLKKGMKPNKSGAGEHLRGERQRDTAPLLFVFL